MARVTDELTDHNYDGIEEYNNPLPGWWVYLFIITVIWGVGYFFYYEVFAIGDSSYKEYAKEMAEAQKLLAAQPAEMKLEAADLTPITDAALLDGGKNVFISQCASCHGKLGEGGVGPNLTDDYWIHGGTYENILNTIMNGVPEKGMPVWKVTLSKKDILASASYILTLKGTNPPNAKAPQGNLMQ